MKLPEDYKDYIIAVLLPANIAQWFHWIGMLYCKWYM